MTKHHHSSFSGIPVRAKRPHAITRLRDAVNRAAEGLIELSDAIDGDPDREPDTDSEETGDGEPTLGSADNVSQEGWAAGDDVEDDKTH